MNAVTVARTRRFSSVSYKKTYDADPGAASCVELGVDLLRQAYSVHLASNFELEQRRLHQKSARRMMKVLAALRLSIASTMRRAEDLGATGASEMGVLPSIWKRIHMNTNAVVGDLIGAAIPDHERVLWTGAPATGIHLRRIDALLVPFSLLWGGFAIEWETLVIRSGAPLLLKVWGIPFIAVSLYLIAGRFFIDAWLRTMTGYALTDHAAYIVRSGSFAITRRYAGTALDAVSLSMTSGLTGTITFSSPTAWWSRAAGYRMWNGAPSDCFDTIADARIVFDLIIGMREPD